MRNGCCMEAIFHMLASDALLLFVYRTQVQSRLVEQTFVKGGRMVRFLKI